MRASASGSGPNWSGSGPAARIASAHGDPVRVTQCSRSISAQGAGDHARSGTRDPEPGALLVYEVDDGDRAARRVAVGSQLVDRQQSTDNAERPIEGTASPEHCVQV